MNLYIGFRKGNNVPSTSQNVNMEEIETQLIEQQAVKDYMVSLFVWTVWVTAKKTSIVIYWELKRFAEVFSSKRTKPLCGGVRITKYNWIAEVLFFWLFLLLKCFFPASKLWSESTQALAYPIFKCLYLSCRTQKIFITTKISQLLPLRMKREQMGERFRFLLLFII